MLHGEPVRHRLNGKQSPQLDSGTAGTRVDPGQSFLLVSRDQRLIVARPAIYTKACTFNVIFKLILIFTGRRNIFSADNVHPPPTYVYVKPRT